jgi:hypothetical protein
MLREPFDRAILRRLGRPVVVDEIVSLNLEISLRMGSCDLLPEILALEHEPMLSRKREDVVFVFTVRTVGNWVRNRVKLFTHPSRPLPELWKRSAGVRTGVESLGVDEGRIMIRRC